MTTMKVNTALKAGFASAFLIITATASAQSSLPQGEFACQVNVAGGTSGLVMVQAETLERARAVSATAMAEKMGGGKAKATAVVECINARNGDAFKDSWFDSFYHKLPM